MPSDIDQEKQNQSFPYVWHDNCSLLWKDVLIVLRSYNFVKLMIAFKIVL